MTRRPQAPRPPTARQVEVLATVVRLVDGDDGWPTTLRELGDATGIASLNAVRDVVLVLERKGLVERRATQPGLRPSVAGRRLVAGGPP